MDKIMITKGEWRSRSNHDDTRSYEIETGEPNETIKIATCWSYNRGKQVIDFTEQENNAKLIATAPELFKALMFCKSVIADGGMFERSEQLAFEMAEKVLDKVINQ